MPPQIEYDFAVGQVTEANSIAPEVRSPSDV